MDHFNFVLLRAPIQSLRYAYNFTKDLKSIFHEGLYLASPVLFNELEKARETLSVKEKPKLSLSLRKYWLRSCTRCTPFGSFAGSAVVNVSNEQTCIILNDTSKHMRKVRIDTNFISLIILEIQKQPDVQSQLKLYINNSLYETFVDYRFAEYAIKDNKRNYKLTSIDKEDYLEFILELAKEGKTIDELALPLAKFSSVTYKEARSFILELWDSQVLISELEINVTGKEPIVQLIDTLKKLDGVENTLNHLIDIKNLLLSPTEGAYFYIGVQNRLTKLFKSLKAPQNTLQSDLFLSLKNPKININLLNAIVDEVKDLLALSRLNKNQSLIEFKKKFRDKYEEKEVPLNIALDADYGIGYAGIEDKVIGGNEWIDDLLIMRKDEGANHFDHINEYIFKKYHDFLRENKRFIEIKEEELKELQTRVKRHQFPNSIYIIGELMKKNGELDDTHFTFKLGGISGPSGGNLLGRFTYGSEELYKLTQKILNEEEKENEDALYAEIAHMPQARLGNVLLRPILRNYEIPYVGKSGISDEYQIPVSDITVCIKNDQLILWSKRLNKRIIPRLSTAHNFNYESLPLYKFLCDLQFQDLALPCVWDWGSLSSSKYLPRVVYKNIVLKKAQWKLELKDITDLPLYSIDYIKYFDTLRNKWCIPEKVLYTEGDNKLLVDFKNEAGIILLIGFLKKSKTIMIEEFLFTEKNCFVRDVNGDPYTNELIIPLQLKSNISFLKFNRKVEEASVKRAFPPHSEWLYFKIYAGPQTIEKILIKHILPFVENAIKKSLFTKFFFIRYRDDSPHLRIRFFNVDLKKQSQLQLAFNLMLKPLLDGELIDKITIDTYVRENERYNPTLIEDAETLFYNDSIAVLKIINLPKLQDNSQYKILFALKGIDIFLNDFKLSINEKFELAQLIFTRFFTEFGAHPTLKKQLNDKYRSNKKLIFSYMEGLSQNTSNLIREGVTVFEKRSKQNFPVIESILLKINPEERKEKLFELLPSYLHMFINRLFISQQRKYELLIYNLIERYYSSKIAILKRRSIREGITS